MPNGDLLAIYFTSAGYADGRRDPKCPSGEATPDIALMATRLRFGSERWDMPELFIDYPDINDVAALLWNDGGTVWLFWGGYLADNPFRWTRSRDNGATWEDHVFVFPEGDFGAFSVGQPINSAFRGPDGAIYVACDGAGNDSLLWVSRDEGVTWRDTGGRTGGRHSTCVPLTDGSILCLGGKSTDIDGYMPQSVSRDGGKTWRVSKTAFPALGGNQRPTLIRLSSGRLFFAGDYQHRRGRKPDTITERGSFVALSDDEGKTWRLRTIPGALPHEESEDPDSPATIGYAVARQAPNGVVHLITSMNHPSLHFEMNEAWILNLEDASGSGDSVEKGEVFEEREEYPDGTLKAVWNGKLSRDGRYVLDGTETWYYPDGRKRWEATYRDGVKVGVETYWSSDGGKRWMWEHREDGASVWTQWWPNGRKRSESTWRDGRCEGPASVWDRRGELVTAKTFSDGDIVP
jgi:hypothetical protein